MALQKEVIRLFKETLRWRFGTIILPLLLASLLPHLTLSNPLPQLVVRSQSLLFDDQPGRQIDLTNTLPTDEVFWLNYEEGYFACQLNASESFVKLYRLSRLCDGFADCFDGSDELFDQLGCSSDCGGTCDRKHGVCMDHSLKGGAVCVCDDGFGGNDCAHKDINECKYRPCSLYATCKNTLGSFECNCMQGYEGDGISCTPSVDYNVVDEDDSNNVSEDELIDSASSTTTTSSIREKPNLDSTSTQHSISKAATDNVVSQETDSSIESSTIVSTVIGATDTDATTASVFDSSPVTLAPKSDITEDNEINGDPVNTTTYVPIPPATMGKVETSTQSLVGASSTPVSAEIPESKTTSTQISLVKGPVSVVLNPSVTTEETESTSSARVPEVTSTEVSMVQGSVSVVLDASDSATLTTAGDTKTDSLAVISTTPSSVVKVSVSTLEPISTSQTDTDASSITDLNIIDFPSTIDQFLAKITTITPTSFSPTSTVKSTIPLSDSSKSTVSKATTAESTTSSTSLSFPSKQSTTMARPDLTTESSIKFDFTTPKQFVMETTSSDLPAKSTTSKGKMPGSTKSLKGPTTSEEVATEKVATVTSGIIQPSGSSIMPITTDANDIYKDDSDPLAVEEATTMRSSTAVDEITSPFTTTSIASKSSDDATKAYVPDDADVIGMSTIKMPSDVSASRTISVSTFVADVTTPSSISDSTTIPTTGDSSILSVSESTTRPYVDLPVQKGKDSSNEKALPEVTAKAAKSESLPVTLVPSSIDPSATTLSPGPDRKMSSVQPVAPESRAEPQSSPVPPESRAEPQAPPVPPESRAEPQASPVPPESRAEPQAFPVTPKSTLLPVASSTTKTVLPELISDVPFIPVPTDGSMRATDLPVETNTEGLIKSPDLILTLDSTSDTTVSSTEAEMEKVDMELSPDQKPTTTVLPVTTYNGQTTTQSFTDDPVVATILSTTDFTSEKAPVQVLIDTTSSPRKVTSLPSIDKTTTTEFPPDSFGSTNKTPTTDLSTQTLLEPALLDSVDLTTALPTDTITKTTSLSPKTDLITTVESLSDSFGSTSETPIKEPSTQTSFEPALTDSVELTTALPTVTTKVTSLPIIPYSTTQAKSLSDSFDTTGDTVVTVPSTDTKTVLPDSADLPTETQVPLTTKKPGLQTDMTKDKSLTLPDIKKPLPASSTRATTVTEPGPPQTTGFSVTSDMAELPIGSTIRGATETGFDYSTVQPGVIQPGPTAPTSTFNPPTFDIDGEMVKLETTTIPVKTTTIPVKTTAIPVKTTTVSVKTTTISVKTPTTQQAVSTTSKHIPPDDLLEPEGEGDKEKSKDPRIVTTRNFTDCITEYIECVNLSADKEMSEVEMCKMHFHQCSLQILTLSKDEIISLDVLENEAIAPETVEAKVSEKLLQCINEYFMCQMNSFGYCMRTYQRCTLNVLDQQVRGRNEGSQISSDDSSSDVSLETNEEHLTVIPECEGTGAPSSFGSFSGRPAMNTADCTWDYFTCTKRYGTYPFNKPCCNKRFDMCCKMVMGKKRKQMMATTTTRRTTTTTTTTTTMTTRTPPVSGQDIGAPPDSSVGQSPPPHATDNPGEQIQLIDCIWNYNGCVQRGKKPDKICKEEFNVCSMIAMGMPPPAPAATTTTTTTTTTTVPPELPDFLKPTPAGTPEKPIDDIDLPEEVPNIIEAGSTTERPKEEKPEEAFDCLIELYRCQELGRSQCKAYQRCIMVAAVVAEDEEVVADEEDQQQKPPRPSESSDGPAGTGSLGLGTGSFEAASTELHHVITTTSGTPSGQSSDCSWKYFSCTDSVARCKADFRLCSNGKSPDNEICASVAENPQNYLVPHPTDCTKFYSCQSLGYNRGWIAHAMDCPTTTGFDTKLRICNYIKSLPRCSAQGGGGGARLQRQFDHFRPAKQTRHFQKAVHVDQPTIGFLKASHDFLADVDDAAVPAVVRQKRNSTAAASHSTAAAAVGSSSSILKLAQTYHVIILATIGTLIFW